MAQANTPMLLSGLMLLDLSAQLLESLFRMEPVEGFEQDESDEGGDPHCSGVSTDYSGLTLVA